MKFLLQLSVIAVFAFCRAQAQTALSLEQCLAMARERSPRLRSAQNAIRSMEFSHSELMTSKLPQIHLEASPIYAPFSSRIGYDPALSNGGQIVAQVILQQSVYDAGMRSLKSDQIQINLDRRGKEYRLTERDLTFSVNLAFIEALRSQQEAHLERESVEQLRDYLDVVRRLSMGGTASHTDILKTELQLSNTQVLYQKALDEFSVAKYSLAELIGDVIDTSFSVLGTLDDAAKPRIDSLLSLALPDSLRNLELSISDLDVKSNLLEVEMTERERWPVISFAADAGYANSGENLKLPPAERTSSLGFSLGFVVDIPFINWGATNLRVQQRQLAVDNLRLDSEILQRSLTSETKKSRLQLARSYERLQTIRKNLKSADENFLLTKSKFVGGGTLSLEVLNAQQLLTETKLAELQTLADIQLLAARLQQLTTR